MDSKYCVWKNNVLLVILKNNSDKDWYYPSLSQNSNITWEIVRDNIDMPWNLDELSENPITWEIIEDKLTGSWNYVDLSGNLFLYDPVVNKKHKTKDINFRYNIFKNIFEVVSPFSRNIDKVIKKRLNYKQF